MSTGGTQEQPDAWLGTHISHFRIDQLIARGGFGAVYLATHTILDQPCAIKILHVHQSDPETEGRFKREARALMQLHHPNVVRMNDFGKLPAGGFYMVMELIKGQTLHQMLRAGESFPLDRICRICQQLCEVLAYISEKGIVHRDLKPGNIFLVQGPAGNELIKLIDFGIAAVLYSVEELTQTGTYLGTAKYGSPEQIKGDRPLDVRSDLYALGVLLYRLLTGQVPFLGKGGSIISIIQQQVYDPPPPLSQVLPNKRWAQELEAFLQQALAKDPDDRFDTPAAMWSAFEHAIQMQLQADDTIEPGTVGEVKDIFRYAAGLMAVGEPGELSEPTRPHDALPPEVRAALKAATSAEEKRQILKQLYEDQQPDTPHLFKPTRTLPGSSSNQAAPVTNAPASPPSVIVSHAPKPSTPPPVMPAPLASAPLPAPPLPIPVQLPPQKTARPPMTPLPPSIPMPSSSISHEETVPQAANPILQMSPEAQSEFLQPSTPPLPPPTSSTGENRPLTSKPSHPPPSTPSTIRPAPKAKPSPKDTGEEDLELPSPSNEWLVWLVLLVGVGLVVAWFLTTRG